MNEKEQNKSMWKTSIITKVLLKYHLIDKCRPSNNLPNLNVNQLIQVQSITMYII